MTPRDVTPRSKPSGEFDVADKDQGFSNPTEERRENKAHQIQRTEDDSKRDLSVSLDDINEAIKYYFEEIILPKVYDGTQMTEIPVLYGNKERWASIQRDGFMRDRKGRVLLPAIVYKRSSINKSDKLPVDKLGGNLTFTWVRNYSPKNRYDRFSVLNDFNKTKELYTVTVPDYYDMTYEVVVQTDYVKHMNQIIEAVQYNEGQYWGRENDFKFKVTIDSYNDSIDLDNSGDRVVKNEFQMNIFGYLLPDTVNNETVAKKSYGTQKLVLQDEAVIQGKDIEDYI